ncbi:MAG TPA: glycosyltransferase family 39 protein, partial [Candidatus Acidoferrales bacterium]|nr:glycosyltransferase family 39 protein [Candidatus Acidoferrales bacterium]
LSGQPLYPAPTLEYAPLLYGPVYFYVSALLAKIIGLGMAQLRFLSFVWSLGCLGVLYRFVSRETSSRFCALVSVGLFAATYGTVDWLDLARADTLCLLLAVVGAYLLRWAQGPSRYGLAGACLALSFLTKQTAAIFVAPLLLYAVTRGWREFGAFAGAACGLSGLGVALLHFASGGWSTFYLFREPSILFTAWRPFVLFWPHEVLLVLPVAVALCLLYFLDATDRQPMLFYACLGAGMATASWLYSLNWGAGPQGRVPIYFFLCLAIGLGTGRALNLLGEASGNRKILCENLLFGVLVIQFAALFYNPHAIVPGQRDVAAGRQVVDEIAKIPGPVYVPGHVYLPVMAGKPSYIHILNLTTILMVPNRPETEPLRAELHEALSQKRFSAIILDSDRENVEMIDNVYRTDLLANYTEVREIPYVDNWAMRITVYRPQFIYVPKAAVAP